MARSDPRILHPGNLLEPADFVLVGPDDQVFSRGRAAGMDPSLFDPVMDLLGDDAKLASQIGNPPLVFFEQIVAKILRIRVSNVQ
jgi:hypothetical protein